MGGLSSKTEEDLKLYLQRDYDITNYRSIVHRTSKKQAIVHQITTDSTEQAHRIRSDVNLYKHLNCQSISNILEYIPLETTKICSDQEFHYIIEEDLQKYNLKEQFYARKYYQEKFSHHQIISILKAFLSGINIYHSHFRRTFDGLIKLEAITIDSNRSNHLRLTDPLLMAEQKIISNHQPNQAQDERGFDQLNYKKLILNEYHNTIREAPQKFEIRRTRFNEKKVNLNQLLADIYLVGILALQIYRMKPFDKTDKAQILPQQINSIGSKSLQKIISQMTSHDPEERGKVFSLLQISPQQSYHLERNFKNGNLNSKQTFCSVHNSQIQNNFSGLKDIQTKKQTSFSFGTSPSQMNVILPGRTVQNENLYKWSQTQENFRIQFFEKPKNASLSNMSTDRTIYRGIPSKVRSGSGGPTKPIVNFYSRGSGQNISCSSVPGLNNYSSSQYQYSLSQNYISPTNHESMNSPGFLSQRTNSFLLQNDRRPAFKQSDYSPFKKQQDLSPIMGKYSISEDNHNKKNFQKYTCLEYSANDNQMIIRTENGKAEEEINRLLKESGQKKQKKCQIGKKNYLISDFPSMNKDGIKIDSAIAILDPKQGTGLGMRQDGIKAENFEQTSQVSLYRPNKEVEEILKRLGIGSLLYGNHEKNNENKLKEETLKSERQQGICINEKEGKQELNRESDNIWHKGVYNISMGEQMQKEIENRNVWNSKNDLAEDFEDDIHDRETTPIRPVQKVKYNSTIVQVGDEDSQYSSSGVRNDSNNEDLSHHQYVVEEYQTGSRYEGYKLHGQRDGHGKFFYQDGGYYQGQWKNNKMHGWGKLFYEGGKLAYEGNWSQDQFHGFGKVYNDNPLHLDCGFDFTNFDLLEDYWQYYQGMLVKDTKEGRGKIKLTNGEVFEGDFHNDRIQGFGKFFMKENTMIEGIWRDSKLIKIISS